MTSTPRPTVEDALVALADAVNTGGGFTGTDINFGHGLAAKVRQGTPLTPAQQRAAYRMLTRYIPSLRRAGIEYRTIVQPPAKEQTTPDGRVLPEASAIVRGDRIFVRTPYSLASKTKTLPGGQWHDPAKCRSCTAVKGNCPYPQAKGWHYPATPAAALAIADVIAAVRHEVDDEFKRLHDAGRAGREAGQRRTAEDLPEIPGLKTAAWLHQRQAYWFGMAQDAVLLDMEMGTGKSLVAVGLIVGKGAQSILIMCPDRVVGVWGKQFRIHAAGDFHIVDGRKQNRRGAWKFLPVAERVKEFDAALHECTCGLPHVVVANYSISVHEPFATWAKQQSWDAAVFDEIHKLKSPGGAWSRWALHIGKAAKFRMGLTGTLMPHSPLDVFGQIRALDAGVFGTAVTKFKHRYAIMGGYEMKEVVGLQNEDELAAKVSTLTYQVGAEVLDLPPEVPDVTLTCTLSSKAAKVYHEIEAEMYAEILADDGEGTITADNVLVKMLRMQQVTGGAVHTDDGGFIEVDHSKADLLADVLADIDASKPVVVFCRFRHDLDVVERVAEALGRTYGELSGRREDALTKDATLAEGIQVAGVQIQAGGTGVDFTRSHFAVYYSLGFSLGDYLQSRKRLARPGQTESVRFLHLVAEGTIDLDVYDALANRQEVAAFVGGLIRDRQKGTVSA